MRPPASCLLFYNKYSRSLFITANIVLATLHITFCITIAVVANFPSNAVFSLLTLLNGSPNVMALWPQFCNLRACAILFELMSWSHLSHCLAALLCMSEVYAGPVIQLNTWLVASSFLLLGALMLAMTVWHKRVVCPDSLTQTANRRTPGCLKAWKYSVATMTCLVYAMGLARIEGVLIIPLGRIECVFGLITANLMLALYLAVTLGSEKSRLASRVRVLGIIWCVVLFANFVTAGILYGRRAVGYMGHMNYGISLIVCFLYSVFFTVAFATTYCIGKTPPSLDVESTVAVTVSPVATVEHGTAYHGIESKPFGLSHEESEMAVKKTAGSLRSDDPKNGSRYGSSLQRADTDVSIR